MYPDPVLFQSLRNIADHKPIPDDQKGLLIKSGLAKEVFGGALLLTREGREKLRWSDMVVEKDKGRSHF